MLRMSYIFTLMALLLVPIFVHATEDTGIIGNNLGLDFYSRIDDAGDALAQSILLRRIGEKRTYGALGCGARWIANETIDAGSLEGLRTGNPSILVSLARSRQVDLTTESESSLRQCLVEKYNGLDQSAHEDQNTLETVGNVGLYLDGDTANSDYDIITDITRINSIIFKEKYPYTGTKNASAQSIASFLRGDPVAPLFPLAAKTAVSSGTLSASGSNSTDPTISGFTTASSASTPLPWAGVCSTAGGSASSDGGLFGDGFFDDIGSTLAGGVSASGHLAYVLPSSSTGSLDSSGSTLGGAFGLSQGSDFYNRPICDGIFCITVGMMAANQSGLRGFANTSIESLLEQHTKMMEPISHSDLGCYVMTGNSYENSSKGKSLAKQIAGAKVYIQGLPQITKQFKSEDTPQAKDAVFDAAFRCAMAEVGLPGDPILANGFIGAGYTGLKDTTTVANRTISLGPTEIANLRGCYQLRLGLGQKEAYTSLSTDLNEIQGFTSAMISTILSILDTDRALDSKPFCTRNLQ